MSFEIGERVVFRSLQWEVADNSSDSILELYGRSRANQGRTVRAVLGLEPIERAHAPELSWTLGAPRWNHVEWKALHDAYRLTLSHGRGHLAAAEWGRMVLEPYQLVPLQRIENLPYPRLMLADDTGLGKTAEAGLILFRLIQRRRADRILILSRARPEPERWQAEMLDKFGFEFAVINDGTDFARLRREVPSHLNVFGYVPRLVMSMHFAAQRHIVDDLHRDVRWDVVIIDEAHHVAERGSGRKLLFELAQVVAERCEALLLLTATPHDGNGESFASLIRLLDPYAVVDPDRLDATIVRPLIVRRLKPQVVKADGSRFLRRQVHMLDVEPYRSRAERGLDRGLRDYTRLLRQRAKELEQAGQRSQAMGATFLETFLRKRLASSAYACEISLHNRLQKIQGLATLAEAEETPADRSQRDLAVEMITLPGDKSEEDILKDLIARAGKIPTGQEAKVKALLDLLDRQLAGQKVIVFTEFLDTLHLLSQTLDAAGYAGRYLTYHGETPSHDQNTTDLAKLGRDQVRRRFLNDPDIRLLLGTDAASEGINLQTSCNALIHMEIPWNPNRYEQRNGRIDRYGQRERPQVYLLVATKSLEDRVAQVILSKLEKIAEQVGSVSNVFPIAAKVNIDDFLDEADVDAAATKVDALLEQARRQAESELAVEVPDELVRGDMFEAREVVAVEEALAAVRGFVPEYHDVLSFLDYYVKTERGRLDATAEDGVFRVTVPPRLRDEVGRSIIPRATFRRNVAIADEDQDTDQRVEFLSPGHPLVRAALRHMRGRLYAPDFVSRVSYRKIPADQAGGFLFTYAQRFIDGRGETVEERFEVIFVDLEEQASLDSLADLQRFVTPAAPGNPNLSSQEAATLLPVYQAAFDRARELAAQEAKRRQLVRAAELTVQQNEIADNALVRLGRWQQASEDRLAHRVIETLDRGPAQMPLFGIQDYDRTVRARERRIAQFEKERQLLLRQEALRRDEIRAMKQVRSDALDPIGALVLISVPS